jgi:hypothetical protein
MAVSEDVAALERGCGGGVGLWHVCGTPNPGLSMQSIQKKWLKSGLRWTWMWKCAAVYDRHLLLIPLYFSISWASRDFLWKKAKAMICQLLACELTAYSEMQERGYVGFGAGGC